MRKRLLVTILLFLASTCFSSELMLPKKGDSREQVIRALGQPTGLMRAAGAREIFCYAEGEIVVENGLVIEVDITATSIARANEHRVEKKYEEAQREKGLVPHEGKWITLKELSRKNKQARLLKNAKLRRAYPEGRVISVPCYYNKTEPAEYLPKDFTPKPGRYSYNVYLPDGYYDSPTKKYPCLFIASYGVARSVVALARWRRWIVVVPSPLWENHDPEGHIGAFLAAYDDVEKRFRVSPQYRFAIQTTKFKKSIVTLYASLRKLSGIVVHETSFWKLDNRNYFYGCLKKNPRLRICGIFGTMNYHEFPRRAHRMRIEEKGRRYRIERYEGREFVAPMKSVDNAFGWLNKELRIP